MLNATDTGKKKGRLSLSIRQDLLERLEPYKNQVNLSAYAEESFVRLIETLEHRAWVERNADAITSHGREMAATGLAGEEFDRI